ncbi:F-box only protein 34 isoform X2 [Neoarius graeffei]|nr:F-box only protein 34 isoform X2 [Neoarius graeffei]XP_060790388.1 F-box only protein 34 isoform X2 [Neoarius graeffei]XP_060790389.1 F-box only protein 34 isoform X2 [Neoarius graeffei]XP_060790390.1 F-box only protein 34 isoform X2 [Neoarius graeffei]XP_060790391.1 F-box only protein 34 isoform X2 [Neoarius graeffei]
MPQKCETISYCSPTPYREPRKQTSHPQKIWRFSAMHLKPYPKPQDKELHQDGGQDGTENLVGQRGALRTEWGVRQACSLMGSPGNGTVNRCPLSVISTNTLCCTTNNGSTSPTRASGGFSHSWGHKSKTSSSVTTVTSSLVLFSSSTGMENDYSLGIYQGEDGDGLLDIWAVIKPGNTKEKIAIFTGQKCSHVAVGSNDKASEREGITTDLRTGSMKSKGCWDGDWSMAKRRRRSGNLDNSRCITTPVQKSEFCAALLNSNKSSNVSSGISGENARTDGEEGGKTISVVEMVAYLEQRASDQHVDLKRPLRSFSTITLSKGLSLLPPAEQISKGPHLPEVHEEEESVRVLDMVAKLESQCLSRQGVREGGDLSRNNSLRRRVGRVLLAGSESYSAVLPSQVALPNLPQDKRADSHLEQVASDSDKSEACVHVHSEHFALRSRDVAEQEMCVKVDPVNRLCTLSQVSSETHECSEEPLPGMLFFAQAPQEQRCSISISISQNTEDSYDQKNEQGESLPLPPQTQALEPPSANVSFREENMDKLEDHDLEDIEEEFGVNNRGPVPLRRMVSHEFLETRFKIQLLLEPQQYMAFLPHHIIVKVFSLLPTESLAALKCTCHYFKFIIESYGVRPADSRWISDPRYKDDPCKQCKKRYGRGDVSLCRWHHKPYCQALPYGPGYWMCCRGAHKDTPGCNVGLHDNRWVPAFHSINMPIYKKSRDSEDV